MIPICMATLIPANVAIPEEGLRNGSIVNKDGHGWAVASKNGLFVGKSMNFDEALKGLIECREREGMNSIVLFHSRYGTSGEYGLFNVHPFYVGDGGHTVMAHNGVISEFNPKLGDRNSDTRNFVNYVEFCGYADKDRGVPSRRSGKILRDVIGNYNKLIFLSVKSGSPKARIINAEAGVWEGGVWYSNTGYCRKAYSSRTAGAWGGGGYGFRSESSYAWDEYWGGSQYSSIRGSFGDSAQVVERTYDSWYKDDDGTWGRICPACNSKEINYATSLCRDCLLCVDCEMHVDSCLCFIPAHKEDLNDPEDPWADANWTVNEHGAWVLAEKADEGYPNIIDVEASEVVEVAPSLTFDLEGFVRRMSRHTQDSWLKTTDPDDSSICREIIRQRSLEDEPLALPSGQMRAFG